MHTIHNARITLLATTLNNLALAVHRRRVRSEGQKTQGDQMQKAELLASLKLKLLWPLLFGLWLCQIAAPFMPIVLSIGVAIAIRSECAFRFVGLLLQVSGLTITLWGMKQTGAHFGWLGYFGPGRCPGTARRLRRSLCCLPSCTPPADCLI
jgi:hypothetical protein